MLQGILSFKNYPARPFWPLKIHFTLSLCHMLNLLRLLEKCQVNVLRLFWFLNFGNLHVILWKSGSFYIIYSCSFHCVLMKCFLMAVFKTWKSLNRCTLIYGAQTIKRKVFFTCSRRHELLEGMPHPFILEIINHSLYDRHTPIHIAIITNRLMVGSFSDIKYFLKLQISLGGIY